MNDISCDWRARGQSHLNLSTLLMKNQASALFRGHRGVSSGQVHSTLCNAIRLHLCPSSPHSPPCCL